MSSNQIQRQHVTTVQRSTENPFFHRRELRETEAHWATWKNRGIVIISLLMIVYLVGFSGLFTVTEIVISGNEQISNQRLTSLVEDSWEDPILGLIPKNNILFLSTRQLADNVNQQFLLKDIKVERRFFPHQVLLSLKERLPGLMLEHDQTTWITDEEGIVLGAKDEVAPGVYPVVSYDELDQNLVLNKGAVSMPSELSELILTIFEDMPDNLNLHPSHALLLSTSCQNDIEPPVNLGPSGEVDQPAPPEEPTNVDLKNTNTSPAPIPKEVTIEELKREQTKKEIAECTSTNLTQDVEIALTEGYAVRFTTQLPLEDQLEYLQSFLESPDILDSAPKTFSLVDLRYGNKIYYK